MRLSIIISTWNSLDFLKPCLESIQELGINCQVAIVDSNSKDGTQEYLDNLASSQDRLRLTVLYSKSKLDWSEANQIGLDVAIGDWICLSNPDILFNSCFVQLLSYAEKTKAEVIVPQLIHPDGRQQGPQNLMSPKEILSRTHTVEWTRRKLLGRPVNHTVPYEMAEAVRVNHPTGSLFLVSRKVLDRLGGRLWHNGYKVGVADSDAFKNFKAHGIKIELIPACRIVHFAGHKTLQGDAGPLWLEYDFSYGILLYLRYWKMGPGLMTILLFLEGLTATLIDIVARVNPKRRAWRAGQRMMGLIDGWKHRISEERLDAQYFREHYEE